MGLYFGTRSGKLFGSNNTGESWQTIMEGLPAVVCGVERNGFNKGNIGIYLGSLALLSDAGHNLRMPSHSSCLAMAFGSHSVRRPRNALSVITELEFSSRSLTPSLSW